MTRRYQIPDYPKDRPTVPGVLAMARKIQEQGTNGCCLHIALEDGNLGVRHLKFCLDTAGSRGHDACWRLARAMLSITPTQRRRVYESL